MSEAIRDFFHTEWEAMTHVDWIGMVLVIVLAVLMTGLYVWVFRPSNKEKLEQYRDFVNRVDADEKFGREVDHGETR